MWHSEELAVSGIVRGNSEVHSVFINY
jgi:hypothetical protein